MMGRGALERWRRTGVVILGCWVMGPTPEEKRETTKREGEREAERER